ncbi:unnamed protein product [Closterium sp. NIES-54]
MSQSLELNQRHHIMHLLPEVDCGPKAWTMLKKLHAPTSVVVTLMLERELSALRFSEGEPVQPGIQRELTTAYSPQSNGVAERANRTILETARALLIESGVGNSMWPHAVRHATVARNRVLTKVGNESWVLLERWLGRKPPVDMLRVFGCMAVAHVPKKYRSKLGASAIWCLDQTPSVWEEGEEAAGEGGDREKVQEAPVGRGDYVDTSGSTKEAAGSEGGEQQQLSKHGGDHMWLKLHHEKFIKDLGEKYGIENERKVATLQPAEFKLVKAAEDEGVEAEEQQQFQSLVGSLLYAAVHTRPDISFSVGQLARVVQNPSEEQVDAAERVVKYLNSHPIIGVQYSASAQVKQKGVEVLKEKGERLGEGKLFLTCFTDSTWASEKDDSSSVRGYLCIGGGGSVS